MVLAAGLADLHVHIEPWFAYASLLDMLQSK